MTTGRRVRAVAMAVAALVSMLAGSATRAAWPEPLPFGRESMYADINQGELAVADQMLADYWPARGHPPAYLPRPLTWTEDPYNDAFWRFMFYSLRYTSNLLWAYRTSGNPAYLDRLLEILSSYAAYDANRPFDRTRFDNKHAAAYRAMVLVNTHAKLKSWGVLPASLDTALMASISRLGAFLYSPSNFEPGFNHGFNEGAGLLLVAKNFPALNPTGAWRQTAINRLLGMLSSNIDADGVDIENSPFYHYYVMGIVSQIAAWAALWEPALAPPYTDARRRMVHHAAMIVQPDGRLPMLGATATTIVPNQDPAVYGPLTDLDSNFAWVFSKGAEGTPPPAGVELFPVSGLFLLRSATPAGDQRIRQTFLTFDSGIYRTDHSHLDALSVTFYSWGAALLPDSGLFTYDAGPEFDYFHGTRAHNTVVVDGLDQQAGAAVPGVHRRLANGVAWATGKSQLVAGVTHVRTVILLRRDLAVIVDSVSSGVPHRYAQTWHLFPGATLQLVGKDLVANGAGGTAQLALSQADWTGLSVATIFGATAPLQGWYSTAYGSRNPNWAAEYVRQAASARFVTLLASGPYAATHPWIRQRWVTGQDRRMIWLQAGAASYTLTLVAQGTASEDLVVETGLIGL
ncbi:MAG TPA: alginate lyase family protein [Vicinamibacteria bacterium]|nr:alginate lyase family protein [Vicinamibacteria bacterium]